MKNESTRLVSRTWAPWLKTVAYLLSVLLMLYAVPTNVYAELIESAEAALNNSDTISEISGQDNISDQAVFEVVERREEDVKHFRKADGSFAAVQYGVPVHEKDESGNWKDIDNTLSAVGGEYATPNARVKFAKKTTGNETLFTLHDGNRKITMSLSGANKKVAGQVTNTQTEFPEDATKLQKLMTLDKLSSKILYSDILDGVDLEYVVNSLHIKENIIVKERADSYRYTFEVQLNNLEAVLCEDGSVSITDPNTSEAVYIIPRGYMFDANGEYSDAVEYVLSDSGNGKYTLSVVADVAWLNAEGRAFPVTVDPPINASSNAGMTDTYIDSANPITTYYNDANLKVGRTASGISQVSLWKLNGMPSLPANAYIVSAKLSLRCTSASMAAGAKIGAYTVSADWISNNAYSWSAANLATLCAESQLIDYAAVNQADVTWDITSAFRTWYSSNSVSKGIALAPLTTSAMSVIFASANGSASTRPQLTVEYRDMKGMESYWSASSHSVGAAGAGYVNHASGNLVFSIGTVSTGDSLFNYMPSLVYNAAMADKYNYAAHNSHVPYTTLSTGYGWKLSTSESIVKPNGADYYIWADGDGTEHYFLPDTSSGSTVYKDEDGLLLTLTVSSNGYTMTDVDGNIRHFARITTGSSVAEGGTLDYMQDAYGNKLSFTLNSYGQITAIALYPDGHTTPINYLTFSYNSLHALTEIRNLVTKQVVTFIYASSFTNTSETGSTYGGPLYQVKYGHLSGSSVVNDATMTYTYTSVIGPTAGSIYRLATATDTATGVSLRYAYDTAGRVSTVTEYGGSTAGQSILYTYGKGYTEIRSSGSDDVLQSGTNSDDIITHYTLDYQGRAVSAYSTNAARTAMYGASNTDFEYRDLNLGTGTGDSGSTKNSLKASAVINGVAVNHLYNGGFELGSGSSVYGWVKSSSNIGWGDSYWYSNSRILCIPVGTYVYQDVMLASGTYTLSADCFTDSDGSKVTLKASSGSTVWGSQTYTLYNTMDTYNALSPTLTFTITSAQTVRITIEVTGGSSSSNPVYMDNVMLENNIGAGSFNAIQFGGFTDTYADSNTASGPLSHWSTTYANTAIESNKGLQGDGLRITGTVNQYQWISQRVAVTSPTLINSANSNSAVDIALRRSRTFTVSGFAKAMAQIANEEAYFSIEVDIYYVGDTDGSPSKTLYFDFNKEITDWQFLSGTFTTASNRILQYIDVNLTYAYQPGTAYFDNISLVEEKGNDAANYAYNANGLPEFTYTPADCVYYEYDSNKNLVFAYDSQGNGHYSQYSGKVLLSETTFQYDNKSFNLLDWYLNGHTKTGANLIDQLTYTVISKTVYTINTYGLNTSTVSYAATGAVRSAAQKSGSPGLSSTTTYNLTAGSALFGRPTATTDTAGNTTQYVYDGCARLLYEYRSDNQGLYYNYDALGRLTGVTPLAYSVSVNSFYSQTGAENVQYTYDSQTLRLTKITTATTAYTFSYDAFGNTTQIKAGDSILAQYAYNANNGKLSQMRYGTGTVITYSYDELDRVKEICYNSTNGAHSYKYVYTATGAIHSIEATESGRLYLYNYDSKGQLIGYTEYGKDANGNYTSRLQNLYVYDDHDRIEYWQGTFTYTANGATCSDAVGYGYEYLDYAGSSANIGELTKLTVLEAGTNRESTISYAYDALYRLSSKTLKTPAGWTVKSSYTFRGTSANTSMLVSNYVSTVTVGGGNTTTSYAYTYDVDGNITQIVDGSGRTISYAYDDLGQLIRENNQVLGKTYVYTYDNGGNRTSKVTYAYTTGTLGAATATESYTYGNSAWKDQLTSYNGTAISYDAIGNPKTFNGYTMSWHGRQLKKMTKSGSTIEFLYNADGIRTNKTVNGTNHIYTLNGTQIVSESWGNNLLIYLYDESGSPIGMQYRTSSYAAYTFDTFYFEKNLQGDIVAIYNANGVKVLSYAYDAWGNHTTTWHNSSGTNVNATYNPFRYRGYYYDTETGLYYLQSRYYNPAWGRFLNADGLIYNQAGLVGYNMYTYCGSNPVMGYDPTGYADVCVEDFNEDDNPLNDTGSMQGGGGSSGGSGSKRTVTNVFKSKHVKKGTYKASSQTKSTSYHIKKHTMGIDNLEPTHGRIKGRNSFSRFVEQVRVNGITEPISYVSYGGRNYIVDGHHRFFAARAIGLTGVPVNQVHLPYLGYDTINDLFE